MSETKTTNLAKYVPYDIDAVDEEERDLASGGEFLKIKAGSTILRFLPPLATRVLPGKKPSPFVIVPQHAVMPVGSQRNIYMPCARILTKGKSSCVVCDRIEKLAGTGNPADRRASEGMEARTRVFSNAIVRSEPEHGPWIYPFGVKIHEFLRALRKDATVGGDFTDPINGFDIMIKRKGTGRDDTRYTPIAARNSSPLGNMDWIEQQADLRKYARILTVDEQLSMLNIRRSSFDADAAPSSRHLPAGEASGEGGAGVTDADFTDTDDDDFGGPPSGGDDNL
jgi:hypothetical protein